MNIGPPPFVHYDVACPVIANGSDMTIQPYVVVPPLVRQSENPEWVRPILVPERLVVLVTAAGMYVHIDPRQVAFKRDELLRTGAIVTWEGWIYDLKADSRAANNDITIHTLFPGTPERFYFNPLRERVGMKQIQISDERYLKSEFFCPASASSIASYVRGEDLR